MLLTTTPRPCAPPPLGHSRRSTLYKLLRCTCLHCYKFRMAGGEVERFRRRLELLSAGRLVDASNLVVGTSAAAKRAGGDMIDEAMASSLKDLTGGAAEQFDYDVAKGVRGSVAASRRGERARAGEGGGGGRAGGGSWGDGGRQGDKPSCP